MIEHLVQIQVSKYNIGNDFKGLVGNSSGKLHLCCWPVSCWAVGEIDPSLIITINLIIDLNLPHKLNLVLSVLTCYIDCCFLYEVMINLLF